MYVVVESVGVGPDRVVTSADGVRNGGWVERSLRVFPATASPTAKARTATKTKPRGALAVREPCGSTPTFSGMSPASHPHSRRPPTFLIVPPDLGTFAWRQERMFV